MLTTDILLQRMDLTVTVEHDCDAGEEIDGSVHRLGSFKFEHPALMIPTDKEILPLPWWRVADISRVFFLCGLRIRFITFHLAR